MLAGTVRVNLEMCLGLVSGWQGKRKLFGRQFGSLVIGTN